MVYFVLLLNLLIAMFSNTYKTIYGNRSAIRLKRILEMKNRFSFDPTIGSVTSTFFPINIVMIPFMFAVIGVKNRKLNEMINKLQYFVFMVFEGFVITFLMQMALAPILMMKIYLNAINILIISKN
mmetsp:Transcript_34665/g.53078  ORF Transcript_34665/g.53078 Transcript_34665/m.53078 type:complete len:126 (+) Transcript_34665:3365-3742(+)